MSSQIMDPQIIETRIVETEQQDCERCKRHFQTEDCIILEMKKALAREGS